MENSSKISVAKIDLYVLFPLPFYSEIEGISIDQK